MKVYGYIFNAFVCYMATLHSGSLIGMEIDRGSKDAEIKKMEGTELIYQVCLLVHSVGNQSKQWTISSKYNLRSLDKSMSEFEHTLREIKKFSYLSDRMTGIFGFENLYIMFKSVADNLEEEEELNAQHLVNNRLPVILALKKIVALFDDGALFGMMRPEDSQQINIFFTTRWPKIIQRHNLY